MHEFQGLPCHLNFAFRVVAPGRAFCAHLYVATAKIKGSHHFISLNQELK